jgi:hypothetical protein
MLYALLLSRMRSTCPTNILLPDLITPIISEVYYNHKALRFTLPMSHTEQPTLQKEIPCVFNEVSGMAILIPIVR